jgi:aminoglycoside phosphotransferase (APT) family kinase protein
VLATDLGRETYPRNFIIVEKLAGVPLAVADVESEERHRLVREAGWAIRAVHEIGIPGFGYLQEATYLRSAQVQGEYDTWGEHIDGVLQAAVAVLRADGVIDDAGVDRINRVLADNADYFDLGPVGHLLHGTFDPGRVLIDEGQITGIIDFGERSSGDPAWDLGGFLIGNIADMRHLLEGYDPDKHRAAAYEVTIPLYGGVRAMRAAGRAHAESRQTDRDHWLGAADSSFEALGHPGSLNT